MNDRSQAEALSLANYGVGQLTHYFSNDAVALAVEIERVIAGPGAISGQPMRGVD
jgi:hypothetical protein